MFSKLLFLLNSLFGVALLLSYAAAFVSPESIPWLSVFGLTYPFWACINLAWVIVWILFRKRYVLLSVICLVVGYNYPGRYIQWSHSDREEISEDSLKVMSYNVQQFRYNKNVSENMMEVMQSIREINPDIICFQEYYSKRKGTESLHARLKSIGYEYYSAAMQSKHDLVGSVIYSKYKILNTNLISKEKSLYNRCLFIDINYKGYPVRVYNFYLASNRLEKEDAHVIRKIASQKNVETEDGKNLIRKIITASKRRAEELDLLLPHIQNCETDFIVCGDWNDTPGSYTYGMMHRYGQDAFKKQGSGMGVTFHEATPPQRLDYIMPSKRWKIHTYRRLLSKASDHYPIYSEITLP